MDRALYSLIGWPLTSSVNKPDLEFLVLWPLPPTCWDYRYVSQRPALSYVCVLKAYKKIYITIFTNHKHHFLRVLMTILLVDYLKLCNLLRFSSSSL